MRKGLLLLLGLLISAPVWAEVPKLINYSGKLTDKQGNIVADGFYDMKFVLYDAQIGGDNIWDEVHDTTATRVTIRAGGFNVLLGGANPLPAFDKNYYIELSFKKPDEMSWKTFPRQQIVSVAYALRANDGTPKGAIIMWTGTSCPAGYRRIHELDGLFPRGATSYSCGCAGGADSHSHGGATQNGGVDHTHHYQGDTDINNKYQTSDAMETTNGIAPIYHTHHYEGDTGGASQYLHTHAISTDSNIPRYFNVIFCLKE